MFRPVLAAIGAVLAAGFASAPAHAQNKPCRVLCTPAFISQSGLIITNSIRPQEGVPTKTFFNLRFTTVIPTQLERLALVAIFQMQPAAPNNSPAIVYGGVITLLRTADTGGWVDFSFNPLGVYSPRAVVEPGQRPDNNKLDLEIELDVHAFNSLPKHTWLHYVSAYGLLDYLATGLPGEADPWVILIGLNVPLAPLNP